MTLHGTFRLVFLIILMCAGVSTWGQSLAADSLELVRRNPDGWFTVRLPKAIGTIERHADVDGGFYESDILGIKYNYWTFKNTPNWLRGQYAKSLFLACPAKNKDTRTRRTWIDGYRAVIQQCADTDDRKGFRYIYYVTFPKLKVFDGERFHNGTFSLTIEYTDRRRSAIAAQMVRSLDFEK